MNGAGSGCAAAVRRCADVVAALLLITLSLPLMVLLALAVWLGSGRPVLYAQTRLGKGAKPFVLRKFRSLEAGTGAQGSVAPDDDPRVTGIGHLLRRSRLDELPQLFSVLAGRMSLLGPRPLPPAHAATLPAEVREKLLSVRPGLTGASAIEFIAEDAVLAGRPDPEQLYLQVLLPAKAQLELEYIGHRCLRNDLVLLARTLSLPLSSGLRRASRARVEALLSEAAE